jgi:hypothetical protein
MSKIFFDGYFYTALNGIIAGNHIHDYCHYDFTNWIDNIPNDCDIVAISLYTNFYYDFYNLTISRLLPKTKKLLINLSEPTNKNILQFLQYVKPSKITVYSDIVLNHPDPELCNTNISWFITPTNFYNTSWGKDILRKVQIPRSWEPRPKIFDCLLGKQRPNRDIIEDFYKKSKNKNKFIFSYFKDNLDQGLWEETKEFAVGQNVGSNLENNQSRNFLIEDKAISVFALLPWDIYNQSYFSIVSETTSFNEYSQFTEKIAKPILARRPFVVFCGQYYLKNLKSLGFRTFDDVVDEQGNNIIDESYDNEPDDRTRWTMAWEQVEKLCSVDPWLVHTYTREILEHNFLHFLNTDWQAQIKQNILNLAP